tara:strand:- start:67 stop:618 length:552 start_codon:yes stop_codon:yes gene_type:complete
MGFFIGVIMCINKNEEFLPYYERAKEILNYNPETGIFTWEEYRSNTAKKGSVAGSSHNGGYMKITITIKGRQRKLLAHRLAWFIYCGELPNIIDHLDRDPLNNKITNLRLCTQQQNQFNTSKRVDNTSGFKGVDWYKRDKKWRARIKQNGKRITLGCFDCPKKASEVYENKAKELFGAFYSKI